jgi:flagellar assembly factor FliW
MRASLMFMTYIFSWLSNCAVADEVFSEIDILSHKPVVLKFKAVDPYNVRIDEQRLIGNIAEHLQLNSKYNKFSSSGATLRTAVNTDTFANSVRLP